MAGPLDPAIPPGSGYCQTLVVPPGMKGAVKVAWIPNNGFECDVCVYHDGVRLADFNNRHGELPFGGDNPPVWETGKNPGPFNETYLIAGFYIPPNGGNVWYHATLEPTGGGGDTSNCEFHCIQPGNFDKTIGTVKYAAVQA